MRKIKSTALKPGMVFSDTVYIDEDTILLQPDIPLKQREIDLLEKWGVDAVATAGDVVGGAPQQPKADISSIAKRSLRMYLTAVTQLDGVFDAIRAGNRVSHDRLDAIATDIINEVENDREGLIQYVLLGGQNVGKLSAGSVNSAILATIIGRNMKLLSFKLVQLTTGALLHDVGMLRVDESILTKEGALSPEEIRQVRTHPIHGYSIVLKTLRYPEEVASVALLHQERWDGKGYPRRLKGEEIPLGARIVAVADSYEAMVNRRAYRDQMIGYKAIKAILSDNGRHFDPQVLRAFLQCLGIHPIGSLVLLNDASIGQVVQNHANAPLRPRLELIVGSNGQKLADPQPLDLLSHRDLFIAKAIDAGEVEAAGKGRS